MDARPEWHRFPRIGINGVFAVQLVPVGHARRVVHLLDDVPPADSGVVGAERDLAHLRGVRNDAHFGTAEIVSPEILEPHAGDEQYEPLIGLAVAIDGSADAAERATALLVELLDQIEEAESFRRARRPIVAKDAQGSLQLREKRSARRVGDRPRIDEETFDVEDLRQRRPLLRLLADEQRRPGAAVRVAAALHRAPLCAGPGDQVGHIGHGARRRQRKPVAERLRRAGLPLDVLREVRQRVAPYGARFVAAGEGNRLERDEAHLVAVLNRELHDPADLVVVDGAHDRDDERDVDAGSVEVLNRTQLHFEQVADLAVRVRVLTDAVELQVRDAKAGLRRGHRVIGVLREVNAVCRRLCAVIADLPRVGDGVEKDRRDGRLAARELHRQLASRLDRQRVIENPLHLVERELVHVADLVGVHEAWIAHHVAAIREIDGEDGPTPVFDGRGAVVVQPVGHRGVVAAGEQPLDAAQEVGVYREHVAERTVFGTRFLDEDLAIALEDLLFLHSIDAEVVMKASA